MRSNKRDQERHLTIPTDHLPPQNIEAEESVLGALLLEKNAILKVAPVLTSDDFYRDHHGMIYAAMLALFEKRMPIDLVTLSEELERTKQLEQIGGADALASLVGKVPSAAHVVHYAGIVKEKGLLRRLISAANRIIQLGFDPASSAADALDLSEQALFGVSERFYDKNFVPIADLLADSFERIDQLHKNKGQIRGISTGFKDLDNLLAGLQRSDLVILAARPSVGKTALALNMAEHAAVNEKKSVAIFSLEMSKEQLIDRLLCSQAGIDSWKLRTGNLGEDDFSKLNYAMGVLSEANIFIDDSPMANVTEVRAKARRLQMEKGLDMIVLDYLQLMEGTHDSGGESNRVQEISEISRGLKGLARELNVPVLALSQLSRAVEQRHPHIPQLSDLRESGCVAGDTLITLANTGQRVPIRDLVGQTNIPVLTLNNHYRLVKGHISRVFSSGFKQLFELKFRSGRVIKASANHQFRTYTGWIRLDVLTIGQKLALPRLVDIKVSDNREYSQELLVFLAHMIGDGCYVPRQPLHYTSADVHNIAIVRQAAHALYGIEGRIVKQENWFHLYLPSPYQTARNRRHPFYQWLAGQGLSLAHSWKKHLPNSLFSCSKHQLRLFLKHLWATDGCIAYDNAGVTIYYATTSDILAEQVQHLLLRLGIQARLHIIPQIKGDRQYRPSFHVEIQGKTNQELFLHTVGCFGERGKKVPHCLQLLSGVTANPNTDTLDRSIWQSMIIPAKQESRLSWRAVQAGIGMSYSGSTIFKHGLSRERLGRVAQVVESPVLKQLAQSDVYWDEIVAITPLGTEEVFDATVPGTHNFVANDVVVHNSIEQDSDVVMFLYREDYYDKDTDKKNIAEVLIRKHRNGPTGDVQLFFVPEQTKYFDLDRQHGSGQV